MKPLWSLLLTTALVLTSQNCSYSDAITHKDAIHTANVITEELSKIVKTSIYYPTFHFASLGEYTGTPSGLTYFNDKYHLFYQYNPTDANNPSYITQTTSPDLIHWGKSSIVLATSEEYDTDNILSGSAIVDENTLYLIYTGVSQTPQDELKETQNLAMSKDGTNFSKSANNPIIKIPPHYAGMLFAADRFRNPFVWKNKDKFYAIIGSHFETTKDGAVVLYKSNDLRNWIFVNITAIGTKGEMGEVWESPQFANINEQDVLIITPKETKQNNNIFLNKNNTGWIVGKLDYNTGNFKQKGAFGLFDYGFDFYAPNITKTIDGKTIIIAKLGAKQENLTENNDKLIHIMSIPREIDIHNGKVITKPLKELEQLRTEPVYYKNQKFNGEREFPQIFGQVYEMDLAVDLSHSKSFSIKLRVSENQETIITYDKEKQKLKLNRDKSSIENYSIKGEREVPLELINNTLKLHIFVDKSSIELFANDGQVAMSSRIFPKEESIDILFNTDGDAKINYLNFFKIKPIQ